MSKPTENTPLLTSSSSSSSTFQNSSPSTSESKSSSPPSSSSLSPTSKIPLWFSITCTLESINPVDQLFTVDGWMNFFWVDETLAEKQSVERGFSIEDDGSNLPINLRNMFQNAYECEIEGSPMFKYDKNTHVISMAIQFKATFSEELELERFPCDRQFATISICIRSSEFFVLSRPPSYVPDHLNMRSHCSFICSPTVTAVWKPYSPVISYRHPPGQSHDLRITASLRVERRIHYWLWNILLPIFILGSLAPVAFAVDPASISDRMSIVLSLLLTLVAFKFVINGEIPKVSTITLLDIYLTLGYFLMAVIVAITLFTKYLVDPDDWEMVNLWSSVGIELFWIFLHAIIVKKTLNNDFRVPWSEMHDCGEDDVDSNHVSIVHEDDIHLPNIDTH